MIVPVAEAYPRTLHCSSSPRPRAPRTEPMAHRQAQSHASRPSKPTGPRLLHIPPCRAGRPTYEPLPSVAHPYTLTSQQWLPLKATCPSADTHASRTRSMGSTCPSQLTPAATSRQRQQTEGKEGATTASPRPFTSSHSHPDAIVGGTRKRYRHTSKKPQLGSGKSPVQNRWCHARTN